MTPRLARPARPGDPLATPLDNTLPPNDVDFFVNGKPELRRTDVRAIEGPAERPFTGHMLSFTKGGLACRASLTAAVPSASPS